MPISMHYAKVSRRIAGRMTPTLDTDAPADAYSTRRAVVPGAHSP